MHNIIIYYNILLQLAFHLALFFILLHSFFPFNTIDLCKTSWTEEPGGLPSLRLCGVPGNLNLGGLDL